MSAQNVQSISPAIQDRLTRCDTDNPAFRPFFDAAKQKQIRLVFLFPHPQECLVFNSSNDVPTIYLIEDGSGGHHAPPEAYTELLPLLAMEPHIVIGAELKSARDCEPLLGAAMAVDNLLLITTRPDRIPGWLHSLCDGGCEFPDSSFGANGIIALIPDTLARLGEAP